MEKFFYCCQCKDLASGEVGSFIHKGDFIALSPVLPDLFHFYKWMRENYWIGVPYTWEAKYVGKGFGREND